MLLRGTYILHAPLDRVWACLTDLGRSGHYIPGCKEMRPLSPSLPLSHSPTPPLGERGGQGTPAYHWIVAMRIAAIALRFRGRIVLAETDMEKRSMEWRLEGDDHSLSSGFQAKSWIGLEPLPEGGGTKVHYELTVSLFGKLGVFGHRVLRGKAEELVRKFAGNLNRALAQGHL